MLNAESLTDEQAANVPTMFDEWAVGVEYKVDDRRSYGKSCTNAAKPTLLRQTGHQMSLPHCGQWSATEAPLERLMTRFQHHEEWSTNTDCIISTQRTIKHIYAPALGKKKVEPSFCIIFPMSWWDNILRKHKEKKELSRVMP